MKSIGKRAALIGCLLFLSISGAILFIVKPDFGPGSTALDYSARIRILRHPAALNIGDRASVRLRVANTGKQTWIPSGPNACSISYHLRDASGRMIRFDNVRTLLSGPVSPRQALETDVVIRAPLQPGEYVLEFDLLREGIAWFQDEGSRTVTLKLMIGDPFRDDHEQPFSLEYGRFTRIQSSVREIEQLAMLIRLTLDQNTVTFQGQNGDCHAFSAGSAYPQIWLRDAATILPASQYHFPSEYLVSWLEEHLMHQEPEGGLQDWFDAQGKTGKNTTETDQESCAVIAAHAVYRLLGPSWLERNIVDTPIIERLNRALEYPLHHRFDPVRGLLTGAHTSDWGDVDIVDSDEKAVDVDARTHWTCDIYDQSMYHSACLYLAEMLSATGRDRGSQEWRQIARGIRDQANLHLWQPEEGFYRMHVHLDELKHDFNEDDIYALGGNTLAVLSGLADPSEAARILMQAVERQETYEVSTLSGTLHPPYPAGFFLHPLCDAPYEYQNGAQWDWFGGRTVTALFENGFSRIARDKLLEIIRKNLKNQGFFEWDDRQGTGRGSDMFCGSAGSLGQALFRGYFGVELDRTSLSLKPRLGKDSASVHFHQPATDRYAAYEHRFDSDASRLTFRFQSNVPGRGQLEVLFPWDQDKEPDGFTVIIDGRSAEYRTVRRNRDLYIVLETDFDRHTLTIEPMPSRKD